MEMDLSKLWKDSCLICLQESEYPMISICDTSKESSLDIIEKISKCTNFKINDLKNNTKYPINICRKCYSDLTVVYRFITLSQHSKNKLDSFHKKLRECVKNNSEEFDKYKNDICKSCNELEKCSRIEMENELENVFLEEEHISSDFENEDENLVDITNVKEEEFEEEDVVENEVEVSNVNIFEESTRKAVERQTKEKNQKWICDLCGNYYSQNQLKYHRMRHDKIKRFQCEICERRFATETDLKRHMRVHTGEKPYGCRYCGRKFSDYGSRLKHERFHTGEKPYVCETCNKAFVYSHALKKHRSVHTGYKEFQCQICDTGFTKKDYLKNHMKKHEVQNNEVIPEKSTNEIKNIELYYLELENNIENLDVVLS